MVNGLAGEKKDPIRQFCPKIKHPFTKSFLPVTDGQTQKELEVFFW